MFRFLRLCFAGAVVAVARPAAAQSPEIKPGELQEKMGKVMEQAKMGVEVTSARSAASEAQPDGEDELARNIVYDSSADVSSATVRAVDDCINPPDALRGSYSIALVGSDRGGVGTIDSYGSNSPAVPKIQFKLEKYVDEVLGEYAPPPRPEGRPGVRLVFDVVQHDWALGVGGGWGESERAERHLEEARFSPDARINRDTVDRAACAVVSDIESMLEEVGERKVDAYFRKQELRERLSNSRSKLSAVQEVIDDAPDSEPGPVYREQIEPPASRARRALDSAASALDEMALDRASEKLDAADDPIATASDRAERLKGHRQALHEHERTLELLREKLWIRRVWWLPSGERINSAFLEYAEAFDRYQRAVRNGHRLDRLDQREQTLSDRKSTLIEAREETQTVFFLSSVVAPALLIGVLSLVGFRRLYQWRKDRRMAKFEWESARSELESALSSTRRQLEEFEEDRPELFAGSPPSEVDEELVETIDLAHVLVEHGQSILERTDELVERETTFGHEQFDRAHELLTDESTTFHPADTYGDTAIRERLQESHEIRHADVPDRLRSLMDDLREHVDGTTEVAYEW